jgi:hypothetical protein
MNSLQLQLSSSNVDSKNDNSFIFYIPTGSILAESQEHIYLSLQSAIIPNTFYNINSYNNILCYALVSNNIKQYLTIPVGNYNIKDIVSYLNSYMTNFTVSYNKTYNKLTFQNLSLANFIIYPESTLYGVLGFSNGLTYYSNSGILQSVNAVNVNSIQYINVKLNINTNNITKYNVNDKNIICSIPVNINSYGVINYKNENNFKVNTFRNEITELILQFTDQNGYNINFNGVQWSIVLQLDIINFVV